jgi:hypothetical protein
VTEDFRDPFHQLQRVLVDAAQDQGAFVRRERKAEAEIGLAAAGLAAVEKLIGRAPVCGPLLGAQTKHSVFWCPIATASSRSSGVAFISLSAILP